MSRPRSVRDGAIKAWFGEETRIEGGALRFEGCLRVDGRVVDALLAGPSLIIGENAVVSGRVDVEQLEVYGRLKGTAVVSQSLNVAPGGVFEGELEMRRPDLTVAPGGRCHVKVKTLDRVETAAG